MGNESTVSFSVSAEERAVLERAAGGAGRDLADWARAQLLRLARSAPPGLSPPQQVDLVRELRSKRPRPTQAQIGKKLGTDQSYIAKLLKISDMPVEVRRDWYEAHEQGVPAVSVVEMYKIAILDGDDRAKVAKYEHAARKARLGKRHRSEELQLPRGPQRRRKED